MSVPVFKNILAMSMSLVKGIVIESLHSSYNRKGSTSTPLLSLSEPDKLVKCVIDGQPLSLNQDGQLFINGIVLSHTKTYTLTLQIEKENTRATLVYKLNISSDTPARICLHGSPVITYENIVSLRFTLGMMALTLTAVFLMFSLKRR